MTGSELADALSASRSRAIAALGKAYVRRTDEPDDELFAALIKEMGLDDETGIAFLLASWKILREHRSEAPAETNGTRAPKAEPATEAQWKRIRRDCDARSVTAPEMELLTKAQASDVIEQLGEGRYDPNQWQTPF